MAHGEGVDLVGSWPPHQLPELQELSARMMGMADVELEEPGSPLAGHRTV